MKRDVIMGVAKDLRWSELAVYAVSLARCGFEGDKVLFVEGLETEAREKLTTLGFILIDFQTPENIRSKDCASHEDAVAWMRFNRFRYKPAIDFLESCTDLRYVVWVDVRDLYFQSDPIAWLEDNLKAPYRFVGARECVQIKNQHHNAVWAEHVSPTDFPWLKEEEVLCTGTIAGDAEFMLHVLKTLYEVANAIPDIQACEQGTFNYIVRKSPELKRTMYVPHMAEGWTATAWNTKRYMPYAYSTDDAPVFGTDDYVVYTPDGVTPFSIVHQYDRDQNWKFCIEQIMRAAQ